MFLSDTNLLALLLANIFALIVERTKGARSSLQDPLAISTYSHWRVIHERLNPEIPEHVLDMESCVARAIITPESEASPRAFIMQPRWYLDTPMHRLWITV